MKRFIIICLIGSLLGLFACEKETVTIDEGSDTPENAFPELPAPPEPTTYNEDIPNHTEWVELEKPIKPLDQLFVHIAVDNLKYWSDDRQRVETVDSLTIIQVAIPKEEFPVFVKREFRWERHFRILQIEANEQGPGQEEEFKIGEERVNLVEMGFTTIQSYSESLLKSVSNTLEESTTQEISASLSVPIKAVSLGAGYSMSSTVTETTNLTEESTSTRVLTDEFSQLFQNSVSISEEMVYRIQLPTNVRDVDRVIVYWAGMDRFSLVDENGQPIEYDLLRNESPTLNRALEALEFYGNNPTVFPADRQIITGQDRLNMVVTEFE